jgi:hypothetical protein
MIDNEHKFQDKLLEYIRNTSRTYVHVNVGTTLSSGQPDLTIVNNDGRIWFMELKYWRLQRPPTIDTMKKLLKGPQINVITHQLWTRNVYCPIVAVDFINKDVAHILYKTTLETRPWREWITNEVQARSI